MKNQMLSMFTTILFTIIMVFFNGAQAQNMDLGCDGLSSVGVCDDFTTGRHSGTQPQQPGIFNSEGWYVNTNQCQIKYDLGEFKTHGIVEFYIKGPLDVDWKQIVFAVWNEEAATDGNRQTQAFFQLRLQEHGMMLRLTYRPGGSSFEGLTGTLSWDQNKWYHIKGEWDTRGGTCSLWRDGQLIKTGKFNSSFIGLRWCFIGKDNYKSSYVARPGVTYKNLKIHGLVPASSLEAQGPYRLTESFELTALPNPFHSFVRIGIKGQQDQQGKGANLLRIYSLDGRLVETLPLHCSSYQWNAKGQPSGIYIVKLEARNRIFMSPIYLVR
jgi:hypothetical protein